MRKLTPKEKFDLFQEEILDWQDFIEKEIYRKYKIKIIFKTPNSIKKRGKKK